MRLILSLLFIVLIYGCSTTETIIKPKEVVIEVPSVTVESDSFKVFESDSFIKDIPIINGDEIKDIPEENYEATFEIPNATEKAIVKVYPKSKKATLIIPKQTVSKSIQDTLKKPKDIPITEKFGYAMYGIIGAIILIIMGWLAWNKYGKLLK